MRIYFFVNMYMSGPHIGIQCLHALSAMWMKYVKSLIGHPHIASEKMRQILDWEDAHKTAICLNGGDHAALQEIVRLMADEANPYAWCEFHESDGALNGALTAVAIILPDKLYGPVDPLNWPPQFTPWDRAFWTIKEKCSLAR